jgi:membrane glycosyltransferase
MWKFNNIKAKQTSSLSKNGLMYTVLLALWSSSLLWLCIRYFKDFTKLNSALDKIIFSFDIICIGVFILFALWHLFVLIFHFIDLKMEDVVDCENDCFSNSSHKVAVLYTVCDDFNYDAAKSCVDLNYDNFKVFLLDDSNNENYIKKVDLFNSKHPRITKIIRRNTSKGYKAGNINNFLNNYSDGFKYIIIADADEELPKDFIQKTLNNFSRNKDICFVQT